MCIKEDSFETRNKHTHNDDDEGKFFDRVSEEIQMAAMKILGFPDQGFIR